MVLSFLYFYQLWQFSFSSCCMCLCSSQLQSGTTAANKLLVSSVRSSLIERRLGDGAAARRLRSVGHQTLLSPFTITSADEAAAAVMDLLSLVGANSGFSLSFCSVAAVRLSGDIPPTRLRDCENPQFIWIHYKHGGAGYCLLISVFNRKQQRWLSVFYDHNKDLFFSVFNYLAESCRDPRGCKQSFDHHQCSHVLMCPLKSKATQLLRLSFKASSCVRNTDLFWGSFPPLAHISSNVKWTQQQLFSRSSTVISVPSAGAKKTECDA